MTPACRGRPIPRASGSRPRAAGARGHLPRRLPGLRQRPPLQPALCRLQLERRRLHQFHFTSAVGRRLCRDASWHGKVGHHDGTVDWVSAQSLVRYLEAAGRATLMTRGPLAPLVFGPVPPLAQLAPGDIIGCVD